MNATKIGRRLRELRISAKISQKEVAKKMKTDAATISRLEKGLTEFVSFKKLERYAESIGLTLKELLE